MLTFLFKACLLFIFKISQKMFPKLVKKKKQLYVLPTLKKSNSTTLSFDVWMSKGVHDIFVHMINILETN
jgi:hypothetical protein